MKVLVAVDFSDGSRIALAIADKGYVLVNGENRHTDSGAALLADPEVRRTFIGG